MEGGWVVVLILVFIGSVLWAMAQSAGDRKNKAAEEAARRQRVIEKYGDSPHVDDILNGLIRQGMSSAMVADAWGQPAAVDQKIYKSKVKEVWKYGPGPRRTYANRVVLEDGIVVGWESR